MMLQPYSLGESPLSPRILSHLPDCSLTFSPAHTCWINQIFGTMTFDSRATELEKDIWIKAALSFLQNCGVTLKTMAVIQEMAAHISCLSDSELESINTHKV